MGREQADDATRLLASIVNSSSDAIVSKDLKGIITSWNRGAEQMFGYRADEMVGQSITRIIPTMRLHEEAAILGAVSLGALTEHFETERLHKDGHLVPVSVTVSPIRNSRGEIVGASKVARDISQRQAAERGLREMEQRFHSMFDQMLEGCQIIGFDWRYRYANQGVARHSRRSVEYLLGRTMMECFPNFERKDLYPAVRDCMVDRAVRRLESRIEHADGTYTWFDFSVQPCPEGVFIISTDITARKDAEETLSESEARYRNIVETANEGIWQADENLLTTFVNPRMAQMLGYTPEEMLGAPVLQYLDESVLEAAKARTERRRRGVREEYQMPMRRKDGEQIWVLVNSNPQFDAAGRYSGSLAMITDITERKRDEALLRESEERFRRLTESLPQVIWTSNAAGDFDFISRQWVTYTGIPADQHLGRRWLEFINPDDRSMLSDQWNASVKSGTEFHAEFRIRRHDGHYRWFTARGTPQRDEKGRIIRWYGATSDIEEEKRARDTHSRNQKMEALGTLAGGIAHDFNNILLAITGNADLLLEDMPKDAPGRSSLLDIERASRRAADLVRRILTFSRQEEPRREVLALPTVIEEARKLLRATVPAQIELRARYEPSTPRTVCNATQVHQILMNLVTNAAHAIGDRSGVIEISLHPVTIDEEHPSAGLRPGRFACLTVSDNGCGMERRTMERIFDPFFTTKPTGQGTGLGLSVVDGIMKTHGGSVTVYSELGKGTVFRLYFPATAEREQSAPQEKSNAIRGKGQRILYVDDDELLISLVTRKLSRLGYQVTGQDDPRAALAQFLKDPQAVDAVVTDLSMPGLPGFELARELLKARPDLPVVATSGYLRPEDQDTARSIGIAALILKPHTCDEIGTALDKVFRGA